MTSFLKRHSLVAFFVLAFGISWGNYLLSRAWPNFPFLFPYGPLLAAVIVAVVSNGMDGLKDLLDHCLRSRVKLQLYGFDSPTEMTGSDSPGQVLHFVLDYLASIDRASAQERRQRIDPLLGQDSKWENPMAWRDPVQSPDLLAAATALRIETEDLITHLRLRRPELLTKTSEDRYLEAAQHTLVARELLNYHAALARPASTRQIRTARSRNRN